MFVLLTRAKRLKAGWLVAVIYMFCVLAPTVSFALPGSKAIAPCLIDASHVPGMVHVHNYIPALHAHEGGHMHHNSGASSQANSDDDRSMSMASNGSSGPEKAPHSSDGQCCGLTCVTALPATLTEIVELPVPLVRCKVEGYREVADNAPPRLYRPPIS